MDVQIIVTWAAVIAPLAAAAALAAWSLRPMLRATFGSDGETRRHTLHGTAMKRTLIAIPGLIAADFLSHWVWREPLDQGAVMRDSLVAFVILAQYLGRTWPRRHGGGRQ